MKKSILIFMCVLAITTAANAQYVVNKNLYDHKTYTYQAGDRNIPILAGAASLVIPGLGQMISGEFFRGLGFFGGYLGCFTIVAIGSVFKEGLGGGQGLIIVGTGSAYAVHLWSIIDAVKVAKVNNLAYRAKNETTWTFSIEPFLMNTPPMNDKYSFSTGLSLKITF